MYHTYLVVELDNRGGSTNDNINIRNLRHILCMCVCVCVCSEIVRKSSRGYSVFYFGIIKQSSFNVRAGVCEFACVWC